MSGLADTLVAGLADISEEEILRRMLEFRIADIHTAMPAEVLMFHPETGTVDVLPTLQRVIINADGTETAQDPPTLLEVPVVYPRGGGFAITWPLSPRDTVLLVFCERSIDQWATTGGTGIIPEPPRKHDWSDAIALAGVPTRATPLLKSSPTDLVIGQEAGPAEIRFGPDGSVTVKSADLNLGDLGGVTIARLGDTVEIPMDDPKNLPFVMWVKAQAASFGAGPVPPFPPPLFGRIVDVGSKIKAT